jgi:hypothetical protein
MRQKMGYLMFPGVASLCFGSTKTRLLPEKGEEIPMVWNEIIMKNDIEN